MSRTVTIKPKPFLQKIIRYWNKGAIGSLRGQAECYNIYHNEKEKILKHNSLPVCCIVGAGYPDHLRKNHVLGTAIDVCGNGNVNINEHFLDELELLQNMHDNACVDEEYTSVKLNRKVRIELNRLAKKYKIKERALPVSKVMKV